MTHVTSDLPTRPPATALRILATNDLLATFSPLPTTYGNTGSVPHVQQLLELERQAGPTIWFDSGDLSGAAPRSFLGSRWPLAYGGVPIAAAAAGNHEFDDPELLDDPSPDIGSQLGFPLLCADRDAGLQPSTIVSTSAGDVGVVGVSHPASELLGKAPARRADWAQAVSREAASLRASGARWVVALWHNGVAWNSTSARPRAWEEETAPVAEVFDLLLGGHTLTGWGGTLNGVHAGHAHGFAGSVLVVDLPAAGPPRVHTPYPMKRPLSLPDDCLTSVVGASLRNQIQHWAERPVGQLDETLAMRPGLDNGLGDFVANSWLGHVPDAEAAFVPGCQLWTQPPLDGTVAALRAGVVTELDLRRLFPFDDALVMLELRAGQWNAIVAAHDQTADFANPAADAVWWNWARGRAGVAQTNDSPKRVVTSRFAAGLLGARGDDLRVHPLDVHASVPIEAVLQR